jgi:hypothetical protein
MSTDLPASEPGPQSSGEISGWRALGRTVVFAIVVIAFLAACGLYYHLQVIVGLRRKGGSVMAIALANPTSRTGKRVGADIVDYQQNDFPEPKRSALHAGTVLVGFAGAVIFGGGWAGRVSLSWSSRSWSSFSGWV